MIEFGIKDIIDILLVAIMLFYTYRLMRESRSLNIFVGIMIFILVWVFVWVLKISKNTACLLILRRD